jgi:hypothetical protein
MVGGRYSSKLILAVVCALLIVPFLDALQWGRRGFGRGRRSIESFTDPNEKAEFFFTRLLYGGDRGWGWRGGWATDYPDAEYHFMQGVRRLTLIDGGASGKVFRPLDDELFDCPWVYAVEVGRWYLDEQEAERLREYLLRGGFLMVDDFHGTYEWASFMESMRRVFPDRPVVEVETNDALLHVLYDLDQRIQVPGIQYVHSGVTYEEDGYDAHWRAILDDDGRVMVAINFNMDLGDAWEHADTPEYPEKMTALAYRFGINYIIYAMTH